MNIEVRRITPPDLWRECAEMTTGKPCRMSWLEMLKTGHSPIREQRYLIKYHDLPQFVCGHLIRHDKFANCFVRSKRTDRGGRDFREVCEEIATMAGTIFPTDDYSFPEEYQHRATTADAIRLLPRQFDRYAPTSFSMDVNAEEIIAISRARLCAKASPETHEIWRQTLDLLEEIDPDLVRLCKRPCVWYGFCRERKSCGYMASEAYNAERRFLKELFKPKV